MRRNLKILRRHIKESWKSLVRNRWMSVASISAVTVTLFLFGVSNLIFSNLGHIVQLVKKDIEINVHIDPALSKEERFNLKEDIINLPDASGIIFSSKEQELANFKKILGEDSTAASYLDEENPLRDIFRVKINNPEHIDMVVHKIKSFNGVALVNYGEGQVTNFLKVIKVGRAIGYSLVGILSFATVFLIANTIKITIASRGSEVEIMRLVGATNGFIRWPFFLEGLWIGLIGAAIPIILLTIGYSYVSIKMIPNLNMNYLQLLTANKILLDIGIILMLSGISIGTFASVVSVRKYLKI